jgi:hypothetical protein
MRFRTTAVRLAAAVDAERTLGIEGLSLGIGGTVPDTESDLRLAAGGRTFVHSIETRELEIIPGAHWHTGRRDWFMIGSFVDMTRNHVDTEGIDPATGGSLRSKGTTNIWFARAGLSLLPFIPLGLADDASVRAEWLGEFRLGVDVEYRDVAVPGETSVRGAAGYFGADAPLLPDSLNPLAKWVGVSMLGGVDTRGGWGLGTGIFGRGKLAFLGCNQAYSSRPLTQYLGNRVAALAITCSLMLPL